MHPGESARILVTGNDKRDKSVRRLEEIKFCTSVRGNQVLCANYQMAFTWH